VKSLKRWIIIACVVAAAGAGAYWGVQRSASASAPQPRYATAVAEIGDLEVAINGTGNLASADRRVVKSAVGGKVSQVLVKEGESVKSGQVIAVLSNPDLVQQYRQAVLDLESQRLKYEASQSPSEAETSQAEAAYRQAEIAVTARERDIQSLALTSPSNGRVSAVNVNAGHSASAGQSLLTVVDDGEILMTVSIEQSDLPKIKIGQQAWVVFGTEYPDASGVVNGIGATGAVSGKSTTVPIYIRIPNPSGVYRSGLSANVGIRVSSDENVYGSATASPRATYDVRTDVKGTVDSVLVTEGMTVTRGQALVALGNPDLRVALDKAKSDLEAAREDLARIRGGLAANVTEADVKQQEVSLRRAEAAVTSKAEQVASLQLKSPINGVVLSKSVGVGDEVTEAQQLFVISDLTSMKLVISVDELDIVNVKLGQQASVVVDALPEEIYAAEVVRIAGEGTVSDGVANYDVTLQLSDPEKLMPGMTANATILLESKKGALLVPSEAIRTSGTKKTVIVLKGTTLQTLDVTVGLRNDTSTEVLSGLKEGDLVVLSSTTRQQQQTGPGGGMMPDGGPPAPR
jgi:HlyD family secretion protein